MPNSSSKLSRSINDQYFTPVDTAKWCYEVVYEAVGWDFVGTALEPAVGEFAFVDAAEQLGLKLEWKTNDLFPGDRQPDTQEDFRKLNGRFDYIITNPPFGHANSLARSFMKQALEMSPKVMMLLPKGARRIGFKDAMPSKASMVLDRSLDDETFVTSTNEIKQVKTCVQAWEITNKKRKKIKDELDLRDNLFTYCGSQEANWDVGLDLQVVRWGAMGKVVPYEKQRKSGALMSVSLKGISKEDFISIQNSLDFSDYKEMCSGAPAFDVPVWVHRFNTEAVKRGLMPAQADA